MNPFDLVFDQLWNLAEASAPLDALVRERNRIKFNKTGDRDPLKQTVAVADLPELVLGTNGASAINMHATSCSSMITRRYTWLLSTGDYRVNEILNPVEWAIFCAMTNWKASLGSLTWNSKSFVKRMNFVDVSEGQSDPQLNRGIKGWSALWGCEVEMHFTTSELQAFNTGD